jgi:hypothetical protein
MSQGFDANRFEKEQAKEQERERCEYVRQANNILHDIISRKKCERADGKLAELMEDLVQFGEAQRERQQKAAADLSFMRAAKVSATRGDIALIRFDYWSGEIHYKNAAELSRGIDDELHQQTADMLQLCRKKIELEKKDIEEEKRERGEQGDHDRK